MKENDIFRTPEQEVEHLADEMRTMKESLRAISSQLARIERRVKNVFPALSSKGRKQGSGPPSHRRQTEGGLSEQEALALYEELVSSARNGKMEALNERLKNLSLDNLRQVCYEIGVSLGKDKPSKSRLSDEIRRRINESIMLTYHVNRETGVMMVGEGKQEYASSGKSSGS